MNKQLKSPRLIILVMILSLMSVLVAGCGDDKYVQSVKNGTMYMAPNAPVGKAFDQFFKNGKWKSFVSDKNDRIVEFTGECNWNNRPAKLTAQFKLYKDNSFELAYLNINGNPTTVLDGLDITQKILHQYRAK